MVVVLATYKVRTMGQTIKKIKYKNAQWVKAYILAIKHRDQDTGRAELEIACNGMPRSSMELLNAALGNYRMCQ